MLIMMVFEQRVCVMAGIFRALVSYVGHEPCTLVCSDMVNMVCMKTDRQTQVMPTTRCSRDNAYRITRKRLLSYQPSSLLSLSLAASRSLSHTPSSSSPLTLPLSPSISALLSFLSLHPPLTHPPTSLSLKQTQHTQRETTHTLAILPFAMGQRSRCPCQCQGGRSGY